MPYSTVTDAYSSIHENLNKTPKSGITSNFKDISPYVVERHLGNPIVSEPFTDVSGSPPPDTGELVKSMAAYQTALLNDQIPPNTVDDVRSHDIKMSIIQQYQIYVLGTLAVGSLLVAIIITR